MDPLPYMGPAGQVPAAGAPMKITLKPVDDHNREAVLDLYVRDDQPFIERNKISLEEAAERNEESPGTARPFAICADSVPVGFAMFGFDPDGEDPDFRYWLWRFMIDENEQGQGYGQAALREIIRYFRAHGADRIALSVLPENECALHVYRKLGFEETGDMNGGEIILRLML